MLAVSGPALLDRLAFLWRACRAAHHDALVLDELARIRVTVLLALQPPARIALDRKSLRIALLLRPAALLAAPQPSSEHGRVMPVRGYTTPPPGAFV